MKTTSTHEQQAIDFLNNTKTTLLVVFIKHAKHFSDDKEERDIYKCELKRGQRSYSFNFGQSINRSGEYKVSEQLVNKVWNHIVTGGRKSLTAKEFKNLYKPSDFKPGKDIFKNPNFAAPDAYSILSCLTKYDPGTLEDFCSEFGYDEDSKKAEATYKAVKDEYMAVISLFTDEEIEQLQEIQ